jgi:hypothetical protein
VTKRDRLIYNPARMGGEPCIRDLRLTVRRVLEALALYPDRQEPARSVNIDFMTDCGLGGVAHALPSPHCTCLSVAVILPAKGFGNSDDAARLQNGSLPPG